MKTNKELKEDYKQMKFTAGVFQIRNTVNNKIFIDSGINVNARWNRHKLQLDFGSHPSADLQKDWKTLGGDKFVMEILGEIKQSDSDESPDYAKDAEQLKQLYLEELQPFGEKGYNKK